MEKVIVENRKIEKVFVKNREMERVIERYPMRITPYYLSLIKSVGDPIWKQAVPDIAELYESKDESVQPVIVADPLHEERQSPVPSIIHRYPDRVIFLVSNQCAMYCRHCMRKRKVGLQIQQKLSSKFCRFKLCSNEEYKKEESENIEDYGKSDLIDLGLEYIRKTKEIRDVILSGGDPLLLNTEKIDRILFALRKIDHVETIRIHTRVVCTLPFRITDNLVSVLEKYHPLYINIHFNHPSEITDESASACDLLSSAGVPLGCQTVLLKGVNDNPETMITLMRKLIKIRVKPYYLHHPDMVEGTAHFRPSLDTGLDIMRSMRGSLTGIAIPQYMVDLPGGYGKVPVLLNYIKQRDSEKAVVENYQGKICEYRF
ncbi:MAG: KamA family radical SAM protein [Desulfamplus sp.]|nr:KamA family radical SAM protein [Desulfamplus sp.]